MKKKFYLYFLLLIITSCGYPDLNTEIKVKGLSKISINKMAKYLVETFCIYQLSDNNEKILFNKGSLAFVSEIDSVLDNQKELSNFKANNNFLESYKRPNRGLEAFIESPIFEERYKNIFKENERINYLEFKKYFIVSEDEFIKFDITKDKLLNKREFYRFLETIKEK
jgi:hypothetical protein